MMITKRAYRTTVRFCNCIAKKNVELHWVSKKSQLYFTTFLNENGNNNKAQNNINSNRNDDTEQHNNEVDKSNNPTNDEQHVLDFEFEKSKVYQNFKEQIHAIIEQEKIVLFMKGTPEKPLCGYSANVVNILGQMNLKEYTYIDVLKNSNLREAIKIYSKWPFIPILYVNSKFIGGHDIISDLYYSGELTDLMK